MGKSLMNEFVTTIPKDCTLDKAVSVDNSFIDTLEGFNLNGYIPKEAGQILGHSGVTVGSGLDLGQQTYQGLKDIDIDAETLEILNPYLGKKKEDAEKFLLENPLALKEGKAREISAKVRKANLDSYVDKYEKKTGKKFYDLDKKAQTAIASVISQYGPDLEDRTPNFNEAVMEADREKITNELRNFQDKYPTRRGKEADLMDQIKDWTSGLNILSTDAYAAEQYITTLSETEEESFQGVNTKTGKKSFVSEIPEGYDLDDPEPEIKEQFDGEFGYIKKALSENVDTDRNVIENVQESYRRGHINMAISLAGYGAWSGGYGYDKVAPLIKLRNQILSADPIEGGNIVSKGVYATAQTLPSMFQGIGKGAVMGSVTGLGFAGVAAVSGVGAIPAGLLGGVIGRTYGSYEHWREVITGDVYNDMKGQGTPDNIARPLAGLAGGLSAGIEFSQVWGFIPGAHEVTKRLVTDSLKKTIGRMVVKYGVTWATEVGEEGLQAIVETTAEEVAEGLAGKQGDSMKGAIKKILVVGGKASVDSMVSMGMLLAPSAGIEGARLPALQQAKSDFKKESIKNVIEQAKAQEDAEKPAEPQVKEDVEIVVTPKKVAQEGKEATGEGVLIEEAKKYKTAEEFVAGQKKEISNDFERIKDLREKLLSTSDNKEQQIIKKEGELIANKYPSSLGKNLWYGDGFYNKLETGMKSGLTSIWNKANKVDKVAEVKITPKDIKPDKTGLSELDKKIAKLKENKLLVQQAKDSLVYLRQLQKDMMHSVRMYASGELKEEYEGIPAKYRTTNENANGMDAAAAEVGITENELAGYLQNIDNQIMRLNQTIEDNKTKFIKKAEMTVLKDKVKVLKQGIRKGEMLTKQQIAENQKSLRQLTNDLKMEPKDLKKVLGQILAANNEQKLIKAINEIQDRALKYAESNEKNKIKEDIKKDLTQTKDVKKGSKVVGRHDYESNKAFSTIRSYQKLSKDEAAEALSLYPDKDLTEADLIKIRALSLQANGMEASLELFRKVKSDIRRMKFEGRMAKNEQDFMERLDYKEQKQEIVDEIDRMKPEDVINWKTRAFNFYRKGLSNYQSLVYTIAGKKIGDKYDLQAAELAWTTKSAVIVRAVSEESAKILGVKNRQFLRFLQDSSKKTYKLYENKEGGNTYNLSLVGVIDIYNGIKNEHTRERAYAVYGKDQIDSMVGLLSDKHKEMADYWQEVAQENGVKYNKYLVETTGRDMGLVPNYWMRTSELEIDVTNDLVMQSNTPGAVRARSAGNIVPLFKNAFSKLLKNINDAQYIESMNDSYMESKRMFSDRKIKNMIENKYGADIYQNLLKKIDMLSLQGKQEESNFMSEIFGQAVNGWVIAKIALSESVLVKQLISTGNFMEDMPAAEWAKGFGEGLSTPKQTFDYMWKNSAYVRERFARGYSEAMENALREANSLNNFRGDTFKFVSSFARAGDITAIIYGGYPLVQYHLAQGKTMEEAMEIFELAAVKAQQSGLISSRSDFQNSKNGFARPFLAFKNTASQYVRKMVDATVLYKNGDIDGKQYAKIMSIYGVIQPALFGVVSQVVGSNLYEAIGKLFRDDDDEDADYYEDALKRMILQIMISPTSAVPFFTDVIETLARKSLNMDTYDPFGMGIIDDMRRSWQKMGKKNKNALDYFEISGGLLEPLSGLPIISTVRKIKKLTNVRTYGHVSKAHANFVERFSDVKSIRKEYKDAVDSGDMEKAKKIKANHGKDLRIYDKMNQYYKRIASLKKRINSINKKVTKSAADKEVIAELKKKITEIAKEAIQKYDDRGKL